MSPTTPSDPRRRRTIRGSMLIIAAIVLMWFACIAAMLWSYLVMGLAAISCSTSGGCSDFALFVAAAVGWTGSIAGLFLGHRRLIRARTDPRRTAIAATTGLALIGAAALASTLISHVIAFA